MNDNGNGSGNNTTIIGLLERIARGVENTNVRVDALSHRVDVLTDRVDVLTIETRRGFSEVHLRLDGTNNRIDATNERLDNVLHFVGSHHGDHEERIRVLEEVVLAKKKA